MLIDPDPRPYMQVAAGIRAAIAAGTLTSGQPVPTIPVLCRQHGCSRSTAGKGLRLLEREGLICRVRGLGYYVPSESIKPLIVPPRQPAQSSPT